MISRLTLTDFQPHESFDLELDPRVTVIVGPSDRGKSSVLRALRLLALNDKSGHRFVRWGQDHATVEAVVDGKAVGRRKGKDVNLYRLGKKKFKAFGQGVVPQEVADLLNLGPENFSGQYDRPLWFLDTPGEVGKELNRVVNLDLIDRVLLTANRAVNRAKAEIEVSTERLKAQTERAKATEWAVQLDEDLKVVEGLEAAWAEKRDKCSQLNDIVANGRRLKEEVNRQSEGILALENVVQLATEARMVAERRENLESVVAAWQKAEQMVSKPVPDIDILTKIRDEGNAHSERRAELEGLVRDYKELEAVVAGSERALAEAEADLRKRSEGRCPTCLRPLSSSRATTAGSK